MQYVTRVLAHYPGEQPDVKPEWPMTRPLDSFLDFYVSPTTHLVRPAHAPSPMLPYHPLGAPCTRAHTHLCTCTAALPPLEISPEPIVRALTSARALSVIRTAGVRKHVGGAVGRRCVYDVQALSLITMRVLRQIQRAMRVCVVRTCEGFVHAKMSNNPNTNSQGPTLHSKPPTRARGGRRRGTL